MRLSKAEQIIEQFKADGWRITAWDNGKRYGYTVYDPAGQQWGRGPVPRSYYYGGSQNGLKKNIARTLLRLEPKYRDQFDRRRIKI